MQTLSENKIPIKIDLHPKQFKINKHPSRFRVLVAGRRFGKTTLAIDELIEHALESKYPCWYVAPTYKQAKMIAWDMLLSKIPRELISHKNEVELTVELIAGAPICLKGADNEDSLRGVGLGFVVLDEYALMKANVWHEIIRPMLTDTKGRALFIGTPKGKNALWELFMKGQRKEDEFMSWQFKTIENPFIEPEEIEKAKAELPERYFRQEYEASFEDYTGLIYPEFTNDHIIKPIFLSKMFPRVGAIDPAISGTTGVLKAAIDEEGCLVIYDEYYEPNKRVSEVASEIKEDDIYWVIDPASAAQTIQKEGKLYSLYDEYGDNGITSETAETDIDSGINRVGEYFKTGKIKIFSTCKNLIWELERYHWSEEKEGIGGIMKPKPYKKSDHLCDCLRYIVMSRRSKAEIDYERMASPNSPRAKMEALRKRREQRE